MAIKMVRQPSETPNIRNIDDIVGLRYAYGNQDGYVIGKGQELSHSVNGSNFTINSGRIVLQGVESDIDANGVTITVNNIATKEYYTVYYEVNLATNTTTIKSQTDTASYPVISRGDDLTEVTTGIANLELYHFTAQNGTISGAEKIVEPIKYINNEYIKSVKVNNAENSDKVNDLEIKQDENGILKIGDVIIPQKKLLWRGLLANNDYNNYNPVKITLGSGIINKGDLIEIIGYDASYGGTGFGLSCRVYIEKGSGNTFTGYKDIIYSDPSSTPTVVWGILSTMINIKYANGEIELYPSRMMLLNSEGKYTTTINSSSIITHIYKILE